MSCNLSYQPTPDQVARLWHDQPGFIWLDTAGYTSSETYLENSFLAKNPDFIIEGSAQEWPLLEKRFQTHVDSLSPEQRVQGAAVGYFCFDGTFTIGFYPELYQYQWNKITQTGSWLGLHPSTSSSWNQTDHGEILPPCPQLEIRCSVTKEEYLQMVKAAQEEIRAGNIYQVCLAHEYRASCDASAWQLYQRLRYFSPAPFAAYMKLGSKSILSSSPESFLEMKERSIITRPIKGTIERRDDRANDQELMDQLLHSCKERAELLMITDLERNDLGKISLYGSVQTPELLRVEPYPHLFHLVSTVEGKLRSEISHWKALQESFPGGSISGAPKKRALEIIHHLEKTSRGLFTGSLGYCRYNNHSHWNIAIRTITIEKGELSFHVGAGITIDSDPAAEWQETLQKAKGMFLSCGQKQ